MAFDRLSDPVRIRVLLNFHDSDKQNKIRPSEDRCPPSD